MQSNECTLTSHPIENLPNQMPPRFWKLVQSYQVLSMLSYASRNLGGPAIV